MYPRKQLDIGRSDLMAAIRYCVSGTGADDSLLSKLASVWSPNQTLVTLSARSAFDLYLSAKAWPHGSEVLVSAVTIPHMVELLRTHGLVPVPVDLNIDTLEPDPRALAQARSPRTISMCRRSAQT